MPSRYIREGRLTSEPLNSLGWIEENFMSRLWNVIDDYGTFSANPKIIRSCCYPLKIDRVSDSDIEKWIGATLEAGLVRIYCEDETGDVKWLSGVKDAAQRKWAKCYLYVPKFRQPIRSKCKQPLPPKDADVFFGNNCIQLKTDVNNCGAYTDTDTEGGLKREKEGRPKGEKGEKYDDAAVIYAEYPRKVGWPEAQRAIKKALKKESPTYLMERTQSYCKTVKGIVEDRYIPHPATWFNQQRYNDDSATWDNGESGKSSSRKRTVGEVRRDLQTLKEERRSLSDKYRLDYEQNRVKHADKWETFKKLGEKIKKLQAEMGDAE